MAVDNETELIALATETEPAKLPPLDYSPQRNDIENRGQTLIRVCCPHPERGIQIGKDFTAFAKYLPRIKRKPRFMVERPLFKQKEDCYLECRLWSHPRTG